MLAQSTNTEWGNKNGIDLGANKWTNGRSDGEVKQKSIIKKKLKNEKMKKMNK